MSERLEEIKRHSRYSELSKGNGEVVHERMIVSKKDYDWLIQRARRADELEYRVGLETRRSENLSRQNQRYKQALEFASSELYQALITGDINDKENRIREVMEKVDEVLEGENGR